MATTRLRRAFQYPSGSGDESEPEELDEEHQERLISELQATDAEKNDLYRKAFVFIPLLAALFFAYAFIVALTARQRVLSLLGLSSLLCTAYILQSIPIQSLERKGKRPIYQVEAGQGPVERYIVSLNAALAGLMLLAAALSWRRGLHEDAWQKALPAGTHLTFDLNVCTELIRCIVVFGLTTFVRRQLAPINLEGLQKARYELKGA